MGWGVVDFFGEQGEGLGESGCGGAVEGDGDGVGGVGDGAGEAADDGLAGEGAVFVGVVQVGVEVGGEPVFGVVGQQAQDGL